MSVVIILLNGTSSSGKSTLAKALQQALPTPYLHLGIDTVVFALPPRYLDLPHWHEVINGHVTPGPVGDRLIQTLHRMVATAADSGWDVVVDHVLLSERWAADAVRTLGRHPMIMVGVRCPLAEVVRRERQRKDRTIGQAAAQFGIVHEHVRYDIEVDTAVHRPEACAAIIVRTLAG